MRNQNIKRFGYMSCTTSANFYKSGEVNEYFPKDPFCLTRKELKKKLCSDGPGGCTAACQNWSVCMYGQAWANGTKNQNTVTDK